MKVRALMYHDVIAAGRHRASGFATADAALYKLERTHFTAHLTALQAAQPDTPPALLAAFTALESTESAAKVENEGHNVPWLITFDDGGASAARDIAPALEEKGWRGWFFMTTDYIGQKAFLNAAQLRQMHAAGHVIGSHSCSHPLRFSHLSQADRLRQWRDSRARLEDVLGAKVVTASVPGGFYSMAVARDAAAEGFRVLFTSEPVTKVQVVDGCQVIGRYAMQSDTPPETAAALAAGHFLPAARQAFWWNTKKAAKTLAGPLYAKVRRVYSEQQEQNNR